MNWSCGFQLRVRSGPNRGQTYIVDAPVLKIGRAIRPGERVPGWIRLSDDTVSRLHCELFWQEDRNCFRLLHRSTTNSTYINGEEVEDAEVFDGDLIETGATKLEVQKADLRWSKADDGAVSEWATPVVEPPPLPPELETKPIVGPRPIPGATVPVAAPSNRKLSFGPKQEYLFLSADGRQFPLKGSKVRIGSSQLPPEPELKEGEKPTPRLGFETEYQFDDQNFSYYNLVLLYDELLQNFKAARVGPNPRAVRLFRKQSGLLWQTDLPEGVEVSLMEGDQLQVGDLVLIYSKEEKST